MQQQKICLVCGVPKQRAAFYLRADARDGLRNDCIACTVARVIRYDRGHPEPTMARRKAWKERHPEKVRARGRIDAALAYQRHGEKIRARVRKYRAANAEAQRAWWASPHGRMVRRLNQQRRAARAAKAACTLTPEEWDALVAAFDGCCAYCGRPWEEIDHIVPVSAGGGLTADNVLPACGACNVAKHARPFDDFCRARGLDPVAILGHAQARPNTAKA